MSLTTDQLDRIRETRDWLENAEPYDSYGGNPAPDGIAWDQTVWITHTGDDIKFYDSVGLLRGWWEAEMGKSCYDCGTACCIAGYVALQGAVAGEKLDARSTLPSLAARLLGITDDWTREWLFHLERERWELLAVLDHALETEEWSTSDG